MLSKAIFFPFSNESTIPDIWTMCPANSIVKSKISPEILPLKISTDS